MNLRRRRDKQKLTSQLTCGHAGLIREQRDEERSMAETSEDFIYVAERRLPYETFDADNHL